MAGETITLLNSIRGAIGGDYAVRIPEAVRENIQEVGNTILKYEAHTNSFFTELLNRISKTVIKHVDEMEDIFSVFKSEELPFGDTIQTLFIDIVESQAFEGVDTQTPASFITPNKGTLHVEYMSVDRKLFYKVSISMAELKEAFLTADKLDEFVRQLIASMTRSYAVDRYIMTNWLLKKASSYVLSGYWEDPTAGTPDVGELNVNALIVPESVAVYNATSKEVEFSVTGAKEFLKLLRKTSRALKFYHKLSYYGVDSGKEDDDPAPNETIVDLTSIKNIKAVKTPVSKQVIGLEVSTMADIDVDALAVLFNMDKAEIQSRQIELEDGALGSPISADETTENTDYHIGGFICDRDAVVRGNSYEDSESFKNPEHLYVNYWQHHWGFMAVSKFADFVPIVFKKKTESAGA